MGKRRPQHGNLEHNGKLNYTFYTHVIMHDVSDLFGVLMHCKGFILL